MNGITKKGSRKITIDNVQYNWVASGNDGYINLYIESNQNRGQLLTAKFDYHHKEIQKTGKISSKQKLQVTPDIVKQVIEFGIKEGWNPNENSDPLDLDFVDKKINLKIKKSNDNRS